ncbi:zinc ABC transporter solute-binding protein [Vibrio sp. V31_P5A7T61]|uniref:metal ABC transporter solute-binding protein, Zn/Mn family n=1 Tax=Vibrio TaxID=662 RepID=UPI00130292E7|nr:MULTISPECIES: zinc ABC transporter substrate-binding protein [Vibrio]NAW60669.1 zinc ABC transporter solute-binding protein [Vibrio sp. V31_P5A7T61]NAX02381.1 zinc ABC transporter solute-binding protein [Vibrio sp. V34_P3A8T189]NAX06774.1 zinc ABC transporter solute-binding protein [Vibrio sp. V40_P2S30T141]NAX65475.1 zinc ABC transporter solute-binding protein [Vibrio sp. V32_P6A28T40]
MLMRFKLLSLFACVSMPAMASLNVFVCQPDWADLVHAHAPQAQVFSATTALQDPHYVQARPSLIARMRNADLVVCSGAELEIGWLPELQRQSRNRQVQNGQPGLFWVSDYVRLLDEHDHVDRSMGDVHAHGNPHVQFAIGDMIAVSRALSDRLALLAPEDAPKFKANGARFRWQWHKKMQEWQARAVPLHGMEVAGYHSTFAYLFDWLSMEQVADLEPKPGIPPTAGHLNRLAQQDWSSLSGIVYASHQPKDAAYWLASRTNVPVVELAQSVGGQPNTSSLVALVDDSIERLLSLVKEQ